MSASLRPTAELNISLVMIVRNEEKVLQECLSSAQNIVSEMIIVDTGSEDSTKDIAKSFGAKIFDLEWTDSFADARNYGLSKATGDWIIQLDADEVLLTNKKSDFAFLKSVKYYSYLVNIKDTSKAENRALVRLFRNLDDIRYRGRIHETITYGSLVSSSPQRLIGPSKLAILHSGYKHGHTSTADRSQRNLLLLNKSLSEEPNNISVIFHLGQEYANMGDLETAEGYFIKAFEHPDILLMPVAMRNLIVCLGMNGKFEEAIRRANEAEKMMPDYTEITFRKGIYLFLSQQFSDAAISFERCIKSGEPEQDLPSTPGGNTHLSAFFLGLCRARLGDEINAERMISNVIPMIAVDPAMIAFISETYLQIFSPVKAKDEILKIADLRIPEVRKVVTDIFR